MPEKILINCLTLDSANLIPLLLKTTYWESRGCECTFFCSHLLKEKIYLKKDNRYRFIEFKSTGYIKNKTDLMVESFKRNFQALFYIHKVEGKFDAVYSISSVLDLAIFPFLLKRIDKKIRWITVFDNIVPLNDPGNKFIRFLAWFFFQISTLLLRKADKIFAISQDLKLFLLKRGFKEQRVVVTGNAVEGDIIKEARREERYNIDALFIGRINETKGIYDMLKILDIVKRDYPEFQLAIMGDGDEITKRNFLKRIKETKLENNIQFLGYRTGIDKFNLIKSSRCFWFFSVSASESFGIALLEAVCCGLPAFAYDLPPYRGIYKNKEVTIIEKNNYQEAACKVIELFKAEDFENKKGELLLDHYSWDKIAEIEYNSFINL